MALSFPSSPTTGQVFSPGPGLPTWMWDGTKWTNATTPPLHLASLSDVALATPVNGQALAYNGTDWVNGPFAYVASGTPAAGRLLRYNGTAWANSTTADDIVARGVAITRAKPADEARTSVTPAIDANLQCPLTVMGTYRLTAVLISTCPSSGNSPGLAQGFTYSGTLTTGSLGGQHLQPGSNNMLLAGPVGNVPPFNSWFGGYPLSSTNPNFTIMQGVFTVTTPGTFGYYWSANVGGTGIAVTILAGSTLEVAFIG